MTLWRPSDGTRFHIVDADGRSVSHYLIGSGVKGQPCEYLSEEIPNALTLLSRSHRGELRSVKIERSEASQIPLCDEPKASS